MKINNSNNCSFSSWYGSFKNATVRSRIIPLPLEFVSYLLADGLVLPDECSIYHHDENSDDEESTVDWSNADEHSTLAKAPSFPELTESIKSAIDELGGKVFPKLNWSSPRDATWISVNNSTACSTVSDLILLLKSSDFIMNDLTMPYKFCEDFDNTQKYEVKYDLVLRKWVEIDPSTEFRCFVFNNKIIAICQRDSSTFHKYINEEREEIIERIQEFFLQKICHKFLDPDYIFDVFIKSKDSIRLVDFNPFGEITDPLLFDWAELKAISAKITDNSQDPLFRCINSNSGIQPSPYWQYTMPRDIIDLTTGQDPYKLIDLLQLKIQDQGENSSDDED